MRMLISLGLALSFCLVHPISAQDAQKTYPLKPGYEAKSEFKVSTQSSVRMSTAGSDASYREVVGDTPINIKLTGTYRTTVGNTGPSGYTLTRNVEKISVSGTVLGKKGSFSHSASSGKDIPVKSDSMEVYRKLARAPGIYSCDRYGKIDLSTNSPARLLHHSGLSQWIMPRQPVKVGYTWKFTEPFAVPYYHENVRLSFRNTFQKVTNKRGSDVAFIKVKIRMSEQEEKARAARMNEQVDYEIEGDATIEFNISTKRVQKIDLSIRIKFEGEIPNPSTGEEENITVKGVITYTENQEVLRK